MAAMAMASRNNNMKYRALVLVIAVNAPQLCNAFALPPRVRRSASCLSHQSPSLGPLPPSPTDGRALIMNLNASTTSSDQGKDKIQYIRPYLTQLFLLCRPSNFPIVTLFHVLGVYQAVQLWQSTSAVPIAPSSSSLLLSILRHPSIVMVLISLLLVTSTSMITNDYYDARLGVDSATASDDAHNENEHYHPLAQGEVPLSIAKTFDSYLYAMLLLSSAFIPGAISRAMVLGGAIITYLYTVHLKPLTWIKNLSCAALVSMSPVTSGLSAWHVLCNDRAFLQSPSSSLAAACGPPPFHRIFKSPLSFLVVALFAGIMSREILMDITDCEGDAQAGISTVPVKHGKNVASVVALVCSLISALSACAASLIPWTKTLAMRGDSINKYGLASLFTIPDTRKVILSVAGSAMLLLRTFSVWRSNGEDLNLAERAIRESLLSVLLVLASFL